MVTTPKVCIVCPHSKFALQPHKSQMSPVPWRSHSNIETISARTLLLICSYTEDGLCFCDALFDRVQPNKHISRGHNELDEPAFTQPVMYEQIRSRQSVPTLYEEQLIVSMLYTPSAMLMPTRFMVLRSLRTSFHAILPSPFANRTRHS